MGRVEVKRLGDPLEVDPSGEPGVTRQVEKTDGWRPVGPGDQSNSVQRQLDIADDVVRPGVLLLGVVHREEGLLGEACLNASPDRGLVEDDANSESRGHHGLLDLGSPPVRVSFGYPSRTLAMDT
jgi:hypothetical protein